MSASGEWILLLFGRKCPFSVFRWASSLARSIGTILFLLFPPLCLPEKIIPVFCLHPFIPISNRSEKTLGSSGIATTFLEEREKNFYFSFYSTNIRAHYILFQQICDRINASKRNMQSHSHEGRIKDIIKIFRIYRMLYNIILC